MSLTDRDLRICMDQRHRTVLLWSMNNMFSGRQCDHSRFCNLPRSGPKNPTLYQGHCTVWISSNYLSIFRYENPTILPIYLHRKIPRSHSAEAYHNIPRSRKKSTRALTLQHTLPLSLIARMHDIACCCADQHCTLPVGQWQGIKLETNLIKWNRNRTMSHTTKRTGESARK